MGEQLPFVFEQSVAGRPLRTQYLLYLPPGYESGDDRWPLLVFLHGAGERGDDLERLKAHGPPRLLAEGRELPFIVISPQCPRGRYWLVPLVAGLLDEACRRWRIDEDRVYLTGVSMGGYGTWQVAATHPDRLAAIMPICGGGDPASAVELKDLPVWAFHGAKDPVVPLEESEVMVQAVRNAGGTARFTIYPEAAHDCWTQTYERLDWHQWLLAHRRHAHARQVD